MFDVVLETSRILGWLDLPLQISWLADCWVVVGLAVDAMPASQKQWRGWEGAKELRIWRRSGRCACSRGCFAYSCGVGESACIE